MRICTTTLLLERYGARCAPLKPIEATMILTAQEVTDLTHKIRPSAQIRALRAMGVEHRVRPDGTPAVLRSAAESTQAPRRAPAEPKFDWSAA